MSIWPMMPLGEIMTLIGGGTPKRDNPEYWNGDILWLTPSDLPAPEEGITTVRETQDQISDSGLRSGSATLVPKDTVFFSSRATIGKVAVAGTELTTNQGFASFLPSQEVLPRYLAYTLWYFREDISRLSGSTTFKEVSRTSLKQYAIPVPPLIEQERIVRLLDEADAIRKLRAGADQRTADLTPALFHEMFGDPVTNPMGWPEVALAECAERIVDCPHSTPEWQESGVICIRTSNLGLGEWNWQDTRYVSEDEYQNRTRRSELVHGDIIISISREGTIGVAAQVPENVRICMGQRLVQIRPEKATLISEFLLQTLLIELAPDNIAREMTGSTSKHFNVGQLKELQIITPPISLQ